MTAAHKPERKKKKRRVTYSARYMFSAMASGRCRPHMMKTYEQREKLRAEWAKSEEFPTQRIREIAKQLGLSHRKVYKWVYDQRLKGPDPTH